MSKFNRPDSRPRGGAGPIAATSATPTTVTHEGAPAFARTAKSDLLLLGVANFAGEDTFYENGEVRDQRFVTLVRDVAPEDPAWVFDFTRWLRAEANMRSASLVAAVEAAQARVEAGCPSVPAYDLTGQTLDRGIERVTVAAALQRPDEPDEVLGYWAKTRGYESANAVGETSRNLTRLRTMPKPIKRGIADAATRLYSERSLLKWDTESHGFRFGDVIELTHPRPSAPWQAALFRYALDRRHGNEDLGRVAASLPTVYANVALRARVTNGDVRALLNGDELRLAGMTWEDVLSLGGNRLPKVELWESVIPSMGYMALLRNMRNFDEAGVSDEVAERVSAKLRDPDEVARSRQLPFRFLSAYENAPSLRWGHALDGALQHVLRNIPELPGRTLVLVDTSASMTNCGVSSRSKVSVARVAAIFGAALALRNPDRVDLHGFADLTFWHRVNRGNSLLRVTSAFLERTGEVGHGTRVLSALQATYRQHDRVIIISDEQTMDGRYGAGVSEFVPANVPLYCFNLSGYAPSITPNAPNRTELGGLTDATFRLIPLLESGRDGRWPWELGERR